MSEPQTQDPYAPPSAGLEGAPVPQESLIGWFWGGVFALPMAAALILGLTHNFQWVRDRKWGELIVLLSGCLLPGMAIAAGGWVWACRFRSSRWFHYLLYCMTLAAIWLALFMIIMYVGLSLTSGKWLPLDRSDARVTSLIWVGVSVYALSQGLLIRWRIRRLTRAGLPPAEPSEAL